MISILTVSLGRVLIYYFIMFLAKDNKFVLAGKPNAARTIFLPNLSYFILVNHLSGPPAFLIIFLYLILGSGGGGDGLFIFLSITRKGALPGNTISDDGRVRMLLEFLTVPRVTVLIPSYPIFLAILVIIE